MPQPMVFWCFQGVQKYDIGLKWVNETCDIASANGSAVLAWGFYYNGVDLTKWNIAIPYPISIIQC